MWYYCIWEWVLFPLSCSCTIPLIYSAWGASHIHTISPMNSGLIWRTLNRCPFLQQLIHGSVTRLLFCAEQCKSITFHVWMARMEPLSSPRAALPHGKASGNCMTGIDGSRGKSVWGHGPDPALASVSNYSATCVRGSYTHPNPCTSPHSLSRQDRGIPRTHSNRPMPLRKGGAGQVGGLP